MYRYMCNVGAAGVGGCGGASTYTYTYIRMFIAIHILMCTNINIRICTSIACRIRLTIFAAAAPTLKLSLRDVQLGDAFIHLFLLVRSRWASNS